MIVSRHMATSTITERSCHSHVLPPVHLQLIPAQNLTANKHWSAFCHYILPFLDLYVSGLILWVFCIWLFSFSKMLLRFMHGAVSVPISLHCWDVLHGMRVPQCAYPLTSRWHLPSFRCVALTHNGAMSTSVYGVYAFYSLGQIPGAELLSGSDV